MARFSNGGRYSPVPDLKNLHLQVGGLTVECPVIVASGVWPMEPSLWPSNTLEWTGALCSKGLTLKPREGNPGKRICESYSGLLNSIGLENPGIDHFVRNELVDLQYCSKPVIVNVAFESTGELAEMLAILSQHTSMVGAVELNVSCPNVSRGGMTWCMDRGSLEEAVSVARKTWQGPLWVKLTPQTTDIGDLSRACQHCGAQAVVVANTWLGMAIDNNEEKPFFERVFAGLSGPAVFPLSLRAVWEAAGAVDIPVIGCGGITRPDDALSMILAGASAVEVGTALFFDLSLPSAICNRLSSHMEARSVSSVRELAGRARRGAE